MITQTIVRSASARKRRIAFGDATERAVRDFQANNGLDITGQIDTNTINRLMVS